MSTPLPDPVAGPMASLKAGRTTSGRRAGAAPQQEPAELSTRVRRGALWDASRTLIFRVTNIFITAVVAHILTRHDFGVFAVALTTYMLVNTFAKVGAGNCLMRADFDVDALAPTLVTVSLLSATACAVVTAVFARNIAIALGSADGAGPIRVMALVLFLEGFSAIPWSQLSRDFRQDRQFLANAISFGPAQIALVLLAKLGFGAMAFAWSTVINQAITAVLLLMFVPKMYLPGFARSALTPLWRFGIPLAAAGLVNYVLLNVDYAFIGHLIGAVELGVYMLAFTVASWPIGLIGGAVAAVTMPAFSRIKHDPDVLKNALLSSVRIAAVIVVPMCGLMMVLARPLVLTLYGGRWAASAEVLSVLSLYSAISIVCTLFGTILSSLAKTRSFVAVQLIWLGALIPAMVFGVRHGGIVGAARAHIVVVGLIVLPSYLIVLKRATAVRLTAVLWAILPALLAGSAAALVARIVAAQLASPPEQLLAGLAAGAVVYLVVGWQQVAAALLHDDKLAGLRALRAVRVLDSVTRLFGLPARVRIRGAGEPDVSDATADGADAPTRLAAPTSQQEPLQPRVNVPRTGAGSSANTLTAESSAPL